MATFVFFHAHPDDETLACGATLARLADDRGKVVVLLTCSIHADEVGPTPPAPVPARLDDAGLARWDAAQLAAARHERSIC